ncbi:hypothetical protein [Photobacterium lutimaris]|nr:hypothetical protein [Photobacterium lutimaris]
MIEVGISVPPVISYEDVKYGFIVTSHDYKTTTCNNNDDKNNNALRYGLERKHLVNYSPLSRTASDNATSINFGESAWAVAPDHAC